MWGQKHVNDSNANVNYLKEKNRKRIDTVIILFASFPIIITLFLSFNKDN